MTREKWVAEIRRLHAELLSVAVRCQKVDATINAAIAERERLIDETFSLRKAFDALLDAIPDKPDTEPLVR